MDIITSMLSNLMPLDELLNCAEEYDKIRSLIFGEVAERRTAVSFPGIQTPQNSRLCIITVTIVCIKIYISFYKHYHLLHMISFHMCFCTETVATIV